MTPDSQKGKKGNAMNQPLYDLPISRLLHEARAALKSPSGKTQLQIAEHLMVMEWNGDDADRRVCQEFRRNHGLPDQMTMNPQDGCRVSGDGQTLPLRRPPEDRFPPLRPPSASKPLSRVMRAFFRVRGWFAK